MTHLLTSPIIIVNMRPKVHTTNSVNCVSREVKVKTYCPSTVKGVVLEKSKKKKDFVYYSPIRLFCRLNFITERNTYYRVTL